MWCSPRTGSTSGRPSTPCRLPADLGPHRWLLPVGRRLPVRAGVPAAAGTWRACVGGLPATAVRPLLVRLRVAGQSGARRGPSSPARESVDSQVAEQLGDVAGGLDVVGGPLDAAL